jgi:hypothetical protein
MSLSARPRERARDYLYNLEAMTRKEAKRLWRQSIREAWGNRCAYCDSTPIDSKSLTVDHVKAKSRGGEDTTRNCIPACADCNHSKGSEEWLLWYRRQYFYSELNERRIKNWLLTGCNNLEILETVAS